jgi:hypothetical protein
MCIDINTASLIPQVTPHKYKLVLITNLMHNSFILYYMYYIKYLDMFRAKLCSSSGGQYCIFTASGIITLCEWPSSPLSTGALHGRSQRVTIPDAVKIQYLPPEDEHSFARNMSRYLM